MSHSVAQAVLDFVDSPDSVFPAAVFLGVLKQAQLKFSNYKYCVIFASSLYTLKKKNKVTVLLSNNKINKCSLILLNKLVCSFSCHLKNTIYFWIVQVRIHSPYIALGLLQNTNLPAFFAWVCVREFWFDVKLIPFFECHIIIVYICGVPCTLLHIECSVINLG